MQHEEGSPQLASLQTKHNTLHHYQDNLKRSSNLSNSFVICPLNSARDHIIFVCIAGWAISKRNSNTSYPLWHEQFAPEACGLEDEFLYQLIWEYQIVSWQYPSKIRLILAGTQQPKGFPFLGKSLTSFRVSKAWRKSSTSQMWCSHKEPRMNHAWNICDEL